MALKEQDIVSTTTDAEGNTVIQMPVTRIENVEDALRTVNGVGPDESGNVEVKTGKTIGEEWHSFTGQIPAGGVPYCGQEVTRVTYADLWEYAQNNGLVKTEEEWQALAVSRNGNVPFYSDGDGSTTFRMPKVVGYIKGAASQSEAGTYTAEGLPNITGSAHIKYGGYTRTEDSEYSGALKVGSDSESFAAATEGGTYSRYHPGFALDASLSNSIYGNSEHVTPETATVLFGVYAFGEITNVGALDADTLATGLVTVEANLSAKLETSTVHIVETWSSGSNWYRKWSDGWIEQGGCFSPSTGYVTNYTLSFNTAFSNTNYSVVVSGSNSGTTNYGANYTYTRSTTNVVCTVHVIAGSPASWYACGY